MPNLCPMAFNATHTPHFPPISKKPLSPTRLTAFVAGVADRPPQWLSMGLGQPVMTLMMSTCR